MLALFVGLYLVLNRVVMAFDLESQKLNEDNDTFSASGYTSAKVN